MRPGVPSVTSSWVKPGASMAPSPQPTTYWTATDSIAYYGQIDAPGRCRGRLLCCTRVQKLGRVPFREFSGPSRTQNIWKYSSRLAWIASTLGQGPIPESRGGLPEREANSQHQAGKQTPGGTQSWGRDSMTLQCPPRRPASRTVTGVQTSTSMEFSSPSVGPV